MPEAETIVVTLRGAPIGKGRPKFRVVKARSGQVFGSAYTPAKTRNFENDLRSAASQAMGKRPPLDCAVRMVIYADMPVPQSWSEKKKQAALRGEILPTTKPDWENIAKTTDALNQVVFVDDKQVVDGRVIKRYAEIPSLRVEVSRAVQIMGQAA